MKYYSGDITQYYNPIAKAWATRKRYDLDKLPPAIDIGDDHGKDCNQGNCEEGRPGVHR